MNYDHDDSLYNQERLFTNKQNYLQSIYEFQAHTDNPSIIQSIWTEKNKKQTIHK